MDVAEFKTLVRQLISYGIFGIISSGLDFAVFQLLAAAAGINSYAANFVSVNCGIFCSFVLNSVFTFKMTDKKIKRAAQFFAVGYCGLLLSMAVMYLGTDVFAFGKSAVKMVSVPLVALFQFAMNKIVTFGEKS